MLNQNHRRLWQKRLVYQLTGVLLMIAFQGNCKFCNAIYNNLQFTIYNLGTVSTQLVSVQCLHVSIFCATYQIINFDNNVCGKLRRKILVMGAFSKRPLHLKILFSLRNIENQVQICFSCLESKFLTKVLVPFYQKIILIRSAFLISFVSTY